MTARHKKDLLAQAVEGLYESVVEPTAWARTLDLFDRVFGANSAHVFLWDNNAGRRIASYRSPSFADSHPEWDYYHRLNPRRTILSRLPLCSAMNCADFIDDRAVSHSEYFVDYSLPAGRRYLLGIYPFSEQNITTAFAVMRAPNQRAFSASDTRLLSRISHHFGRASRVHRRMLSARLAGSLSDAALDSVTDAILVVDPTGRVIRANVAAVQMFQAGGAFCCISGRIQAAFEDDTTRLRGLIAKAGRDETEGGGPLGGTLTLRTVNDQKCVVTVSPLMPSAELFDLTDHRLVLVLVSTTTLPKGVADQLRQAFGLTLAEARLATRIGSGETLADVADASKLSVETLRSQLKSILHKTDTRRQAELVKLTAAFGKVRKPD